MAQRKYPKANTSAQWFETKFARKLMNPVTKLLLHTTETAGWPAYDGGASAPTITYNPWLSSGRWRQHNYIDTSARALRDPSGTQVRENQDGVVQVEIICYCDPKLYAKYGKGVNKLPDSAYVDLGDFLAFLHTEYDVPLVRAPEWDTFPPSDSIRMTGPEYDRFKGVLGHQHASGNTHGDPGMTNAQVDRILAAAKKKLGASAPSKGLTVSEYTDLLAEVKRQGDATRLEVRRQAIWGLRYGAQTEDEKQRADQAFDTAYDAAKAAGKSEMEALDAGQKAAQSVMQPINDDLTQRALENG